jgi:putative ABC transport system permease protein
VLRLALRNALAHKLRFLLTTMAVVSGVAFVVGSFVVTDSLRASVDQLFRDITGGVDVSVRAESNIEANGMMLVRGRIDGDLIGVVESVDGVAAAEGSIGGYAQLLDLTGEPVTTTGAPLLGVSWGSVDALRPATLDQGRAPIGAAQVAIDRGTAVEYGFSVGDRTHVLLASGDQPEVEIVGIFTFGDANNLMGARLTAFDVAVADDLLGEPGKVDSIDVVAEPGVDDETLAQRIGDVLPDGVESVTGAEVAAEAQNAVAGLLGAFQNVLLGFAGVALFVSAFFINNTFSILVGQRTRQLALLRSIGGTPAQITRSVVLEAVGVGLLASVLGVGFGLLIALALQAILSAAGFGLPPQSLSLAGRTVVAALVVGVGATVLASLAPARRASRVAPVEGMRGELRARRSSMRLRRVAGSVLVIGGGGLMLFGLFVADATTTTLAALAVGAIAVFVGVAQLGPVVAIPVASVLGRPIAPLFGTAGRLAHANAVRNPERTSKTASALMIGLALVTMVFVVGTSMKRTFSASVEKAVSADFVLSTESFTGFSPALTEQVAGVTGVEAVTGVRLGRFEFEGSTRDLVAVDATSAGEVVDVDLRSGSFADLDEDGIFVHVDPAADLGLDVGDQVTVEFPSGGPTSLTVAGIYGDATYAGNYLIDMERFEAEFPTMPLDLFAFVRLGPNADLEAARGQLEEVVGEFPQVTLDDRAGFRAEQESQFDSLLLAINALLGLALFIALLGIANTLALSVLERTHEIGLLRAVGMARRQTRAMLLAESAMVAVLGAAIGVAVGVVFGVAVTAAMPPSIVDRTAIPFGALASIMAVALACGLIAGLLPARRAARLDVLQAVATE